LTEPRVLIVGAGYCGLAAAMELERSNTPYMLVEQASAVGGLSTTLDSGSVSFELGPHIYFNKDEEVTAFWRSLIGADLRRHERHTRIFYQGRYISSPLRVIDTLLKLGPWTVALILASFARAKLSRGPVLNAEDWVIANFGRQLYERFFKVYNEKIWGIASSAIAPNWAGQRIKSSLLSMVVRSVLRDPAFIVKTFDFPAGGSRQLAAAQEAIIRRSASGTLRLGCRPERIVRDATGFAVTFDGQDDIERFSHVISTTHLSDLSAVLDYQGKDEVALRQAIGSLVYRNLVLVNLVLPAAQVRSMQEHWIDIHDPTVRALRVTNFSNYLVGDKPDKIALGVEYNCFDGDAVWTATDAQIGAMALADLRTMQLFDAAPESVQVVRLAKAYPVYALGYQQHTTAIFAELGKVEGLILAGRNAMFKWNNMHHSVKTGLMAARNVLGAGLDLGAVRGNVTIGKDSD